MYYGWIVSPIELIPRSTRSKLNSKPAEAFRALAMLPWASNHVPVVYKYFKCDNEPTAIANEVYGYYLAKKLGLPVTRSIDICACDRNLLPGPSLCMEGRSPKCQWLKGVATRDETPSGVITFPPSYESRIIDDDLRRWEYLPQAAVFDELVANRDRNVGNLYRIGERRFLLIDHADILGGQAWKLETMQERLKDTTMSNHLAGFIAEYTEKEVQERMMSYAVELSKRTPYRPGDVGIESLALDEKCGLAPGTTDQIFELLAERQARLPEALFYYLRHADLFSQTN